jgi:hypothetical protein
MKTIDLYHLEKYLFEKVNPLFMKDGKIKAQGGVKEIAGERTEPKEVVPG